MSLPSGKFIAWRLVLFIRGISEPTFIQLTHPILLYVWHFKPGSSIPVLKSVDMPNDTYYELSDYLITNDEATRQYVIKVLSDYFTMLP